jgi:acid stress chaperone HdeB
MSRNVFVIATVLLVTASLPSAAQVNLDMNRITCGDWLGYSLEGREFVRFWMSGYYNAAANQNVLDYNRLQRNSAKVTTYCRKNKSRTLPTAIKLSTS